MELSRVFQIASYGEKQFFQPPHVYDPNTDRNLLQCQGNTG